MQVAPHLSFPSRTRSASTRLDVPTETETETVLEYATEKLQLMRQTALTVAEQITLLSNGMPPHYRTALITAQITDIAKWMDIARQLESSFQRAARSNPQSNQPAQAHRFPVAAAANSSAPKSKPNPRDPNAKPATPCRHCTKRGKTEYHWNKECPVNAASANAASANAARNTDHNQAASPADEAFASLASLGAVSFHVSREARKARSGFVYVDVSVHGVSTKALVDTGSNVSLVSREFIRLLNVQFTECEEQLTHIDGATLTLGSAIVPITMDSETHHLPVLVVEHLPVEILLGLDAQSAFDLYIGARLRYAVRGASVRARHGSTPKVPFASSNLASHPLARPLGIPKPRAPTPPPRSDVPDLSVLYGNVTLHVLSKAALRKPSNAPKKVPVRAAPPVLPLPDHCKPKSGQQIHPVMIAVIVKHKRLWSRGEFDLGCVTIVRHKIPTRPHAPVRRAPYRLPPHQLEALRRIIAELLRLGLIRISRSPYATPVFLVPKSLGGWRMVQDLRPINEFTLDDPEPVTLIQDIIDALFNATFITIVDISCSYNNVLMDPEYIPLTAFVTPDGHYEWLVMNMGGKGAAATLFCAVRAALGKLLFVCVKFFFDDICIYTFGDIHEHANICDQVFTRLFNVGFKLRFEKAQFAQKRVELLGMIVGENKVAVSPSKTLAITNFPRPDSVRALRRFVGLATYLRTHVPHFTEMMMPLFAAIGQPKKKNAAVVAVRFVWTDEMEAAFQQAKIALASPPALGIYNPKVPCEVHTDASSVGIGAVLIQRDERGNEIRIAYFSKRLAGAQNNWHATDLEGLALVESTEHWQCYLHLPFVVYTDHAALPWIKNSPKLTGRLHRWFVRLSRFTFVIKHRKGKDMEPADALSRAFPSAITLLAVSRISLPVPDDELARLQLAEPATDCSTFLFGTLQCVKRRGMTLRYVPPSARTRILQHAHLGHSHPGCRKTRLLIADRYFWPTLATDVANFCNACVNCQQTKTSGQPRLGLMQPVPFVSEPFELWATDTVVIGRAAQDSKAKYLQVIVDHATRFAWTFATPTNTTAVILRCLKAAIGDGPAPKSLLTDQAPNYQSHVFSSFCEQLNIKHLNSSPYHAATNGKCEKLNHTIVVKLRLYVGDNPSHKWSTGVPAVTSAYNATPHDVTLFSPFFLQFGHHPPTTPLPVESSIDVAEARLLARSRTEAHFASRKRLHDKGVKAHDFSQGEEVLMRIADNHPSLDKLSARYEGPFTVVETCGPNNVRLARPSHGKATTVANVSLLKRFLRTDL